MATVQPEAADPIRAAEPQEEEEEEEETEQQRADASAPVAPEVSEIPEISSENTENREVPEVAQSPLSGVEMKSLPLSDLKSMAHDLPATPTAAGAAANMTPQARHSGRDDDDAGGIPSKTLAPASSPPTKVCQYFVLSPRPSVESPESRPDYDENVNQNIRNIQGKYSTKTPTKKLMRGPGNQAIRTNYRDQPCLRPASAERIGTPSRRTATALASTTPRRPLTAISGRDATPGHLNNLSTQESTEALTNVEAHLSVMSSCSHLSQESRLSRLSRKTTSKKYMSSKEMEELAIQQKREQIREMIARNQSSCRKAIASAEFNSGGRALNSVRHVTVPREFHLSGSTRTPRTARPARDTSADSMSVCSERSARSNQSVSGSVSSKPWRPRLTVPEAPPLSVSNRKPRPSQSQPEVSVRPMTPRTAQRPRAPSKDNNAATAAASTARKPSATTTMTPRPSTPQRGTGVAGSAVGTSRVATRASTPDRQRPSSAKVVGPSGAAATSRTPSTQKPAANAKTATTTAAATSSSAATTARMGGAAKSATGMHPASGSRAKTAAATATTTNTTTSANSAAAAAGNSSTTATATTTASRPSGNASAKERAEQARLLAAKKKADQERAAKDKLSVFRRPTATPARSTARTMVTSKATQTVELEEVGVASSNKEIGNDNSASNSIANNNNSNSNDDEEKRDTDAPSAASAIGASAVAIEVAQDGAQLMTSPLRPCGN